MKFACALRQSDMVRKCGSKLCCGIAELITARRAVQMGPTPSSLRGITIRAPFWGPYRYWLSDLSDDVRR